MEEGEPTRGTEGVPPGPAHRPPQTGWRVRGPQQRATMRHAVLGGSAWASAAAFVKLFGLRDIVRSHGWMFLGLFAGCWVLHEAAARLSARVPSPRRTWLSAAFAALLGLTITVGTGFGPGQPAPFVMPAPAMLLAGLLMTVSIAAGTSLALHRLEAHGWTGQRPATWRWWAGASVVIFVSYLGSLVQFYPGVLSTDSFASIAQALGLEARSDAHPFAFTAALAACLRLAGVLGGGPAQGVALFCLAQIAFAALAFGFVVWRLAACGLGRRAPVLACGFFALSPIVRYYVVIVWKDILFSVAVLALTVVLLECVRMRHWLTSGRLAAVAGVLALAALLLRHNAILPVAALIPTLLLAYRRQALRLAGALVAALVCSALITGPGYHALGVRTSPAAESLAIPLQQIGYTLRYDGDLRPDERAFLDRVFPTARWRACYDPRVVDAVKFQPEFDNAPLVREPARFWANYARVGLRNPRSYLYAWMLQTSGYWHLGETNPGMLPPPVTQGPWSHLVQPEDVWTKERGAAAHQRDFDRLTGRVRNWATLSGFVSISLSVWLLLAVGLACIHRRQYGGLVALVPLFGLWISILVSAPVHCESRYLFALHLAIPVLVAALCHGGAAARPVPAASAAPPGGPHDRRDQRECAKRSVTGKS